MRASPLKLQKLELPQAGETDGRAEPEREQLEMAIALAAHELRGPLVGARAAIDSFLRQKRKPSENDHLLHRALAEVEYLASLLDALFRWAGAHGSLHPRRTDLVRLVRGAVESCAVEARAAQISVTAPPRAICQVDPIHLREAIENLVRNAVAYSPSNGKVEVRVERRNGTIAISVKDDGPGIPESERETIFDPFVRGRLCRSRGGMGLGLFVARRVVEAHHGVIRLESGGKGATFRIQLPVDNGGKQSFGS